MARQRNYREEERRRNALARERGFTSRAQERRVIRQSREWSRQHAHRPIAQYDPARAKTDPRYIRAYYDAFVNPHTSYRSLKRGKRGTPEIRRYMVDVMDYLTATDYDQRYGSVD